MPESSLPIRGYAPDRRCDADQSHFELVDLLVPKALSPFLSLALQSAAPEHSFIHAIAQQVLEGSATGNPRRWAGFKESQRTVERIFQLKWLVSPHQQAPLLKERKQFLVHCEQQGTSHKAVHNMAPELIAVIRLLRLQELREVRLEEIKQAAKAWSEEQLSNPRARSYPKSASYFIFVAKKWLRFHGKLTILRRVRVLLTNSMTSWHSWRLSKASPISIGSHRWKTSKFLEWFANRHRLLSSATLDDVDELFGFKANNGWNRQSVSTAAQALRSFLGHAERRGCASQE